MDRGISDVYEKLNFLLSSDNLNISQKKYLFKLRKLYMKNLRIDNLREFENDLYHGMKDDEKILFELDRINYKLDSLEKSGAAISSDMAFIMRRLILKTKNKERRNTFNDAILNSIIKVEIELGMNVGLLVEFNSFLEVEVDKYMDYVKNNYDINDIEKEEDINNSDDFARTKGL